MPKMCFSYPAAVPPGTRIRNTAQSAQSGYLGCFSYPAAVPPGTRTRNAAQSVQYGLLHCFSYPADVSPDLCQMTTSSSCFRY